MFRQSTIGMLVLAVASFDLAYGQSAPVDVINLTVDVAGAKAEISPLVYGQFIEHLGRCIRDGIWAEKLRDRKFLLELDKSPWQPRKPAGAEADVFLDPAGAYGGAHALAVWVRDSADGPCGVSQGGIGLLQDKEYVGYAVLAAPAEPVGAEVRIAWGDGDADGVRFPLAGLAATHKRFPFRFKAGATTDDARISLTVGKGLVWAACLSLMPADNVRGMRADTLELLRQLNAPIYRWPGGNFVSGYNWKDVVVRPARESTACRQTSATTGSAGPIAFGTTTMPLSATV